MDEIGWRSAWQIRLGHARRDLAHRCSESKTPLESGSRSSSATLPSSIDLDTAAIDKAVGAKGKVNGGVEQFNIPRAEPIKEAGMEVPEAMGSANAINFQLTGAAKAAITGDFVLIAEEVNPVSKALRDNGIEVTAIYNHMLNDQPRLFFMHFWANDDVNKLAKGLRQRSQRSIRRSTAEAGCPSPTQMRQRAAALGNHPAIGHLRVLMHAFI